MNFYDYKGAVHVHSTYSDGTGSVSEIMEGAVHAGLDFVILTDHDTIKALEEGHEGWYGGSLLIVGTEISPRYNHYIAFGSGDLKNLDGMNKKTPQEFIDEINSQGWVGFISHPDHQGVKRFDIPAYPWLDWEVDRFVGICVWDFMSDWQEQLDRQDISFEIYSDFPRWLTGAKEVTLKRWDEFTQRRKVVGIGELDNHKALRDYQGEKITAFPYDLCFRTITNHLLLSQPLDKDKLKAKQQIVEAFRQGRLYISFDYWDDPTEFSFEIESGDACVTMGQQITLEQKGQLILSLPAKAHINIVCNGKTIWEGEEDETIMDIQQRGVYRVEAIRNDLIWIISNPIYVG
jgi:hypothetical protein